MSVSRPANTASLLRKGATAFRAKVCAWYRDGWLHALVICLLLGCAYPALALWTGSQVGMIRDFPFGRGMYYGPWSAPVFESGFSFLFWASLLCGACVGWVWEWKAERSALPLLQAPWGLCAWYAFWLTPVDGLWYSSLLNSFGIVALGFAHWLTGLGVYRLVEKKQRSRFLRRASS